MPLYLQASCHPDYLEIFSGVTLNVKDGVFDEESSASSLAGDYFQKNYANGVFPDTYGIPSSIVYIPFNYKSEKSSINGASITAQTLGTVITSGFYKKTLLKLTFF